MIGPLFRTIISRLLLLIVMIIFALPALIMIIVPKRWLYDSTLFFGVTHAFYWMIIRFSFLPIKFHGIEHIPQEPCIIIANHQSSLDIPLVGYTLKTYPHIWLAKYELMESPILRFILPRLAVLVDMSSPMRGMRSLVEALQHIQGKNRHVILFPEGGRYTDGTVHEFFSGFVILAKKLGRPVVPIRIFGANKVYPPDAFLVDYHPIDIVVGKPFHMQPDETEDAFKQRVYQWFVNEPDPQ